MGEQQQGQSVDARVVPIDGQPFWRICAAGVCVLNQSGLTARRMLAAALERRGLSG